MITLNNIRTGQPNKPPRIMIYGLPGLGKTSLAAEFPSPVFLQTSEEFPSGVDAATFGKLNTYDEFQQAIAALKSGGHQYRTVVLDHLAEFEALLLDKVCRDNHWRNIEAPGYGRGYAVTKDYWKTFVDDILSLRDNPGMCVILLGHVEILTFPNPSGPEFQRFDLLLDKRARPIVTAKMDACLMLGQMMTTKDAGGHAIASGGEGRWIFTSGRPEMLAKNRYGMPDRIKYEIGNGFEVMKPYFKKPKTSENIVTYDVNIVSQMGE